LHPAGYCDNSIEHPAETIFSNHYNNTSIAPTSSPPHLPSPTIISSLTFTVLSTATPTALPPEGQAFTIGLSVEGKRLDAYRFGSGPIVRMIIGGIHGGYEANTATLVYMLRDDLRSGLIKVPGDITLYLLPMLNPDVFRSPERTAGTHQCPRRGS